MSRSFWDVFYSNFLIIVALIPMVILLNIYMTNFPNPLGWFGDVE